MKIRFEKNQIIFRLSVMERDKLLEQKYLCANTPLPQGKKFHYKLRLESEKPFFNCDNNDTELNIPYADFESHVPNKSGLTYKFETDKEALSVSVQVDLKSFRKRA